MVKSEEEQGETQTCQRSHSAEASRAAASPFGSAPYLPSPAAPGRAEEKRSRRRWSRRFAPSESPAATDRRRAPGRRWRLDEEGGVGGDSRARTQKWAPLRRLALGQGERESILGVHLKVKGVFFPFSSLIGFRQGRPGL